MKKRISISLVALLLTAFQGFSQVIPVGSGSYTKTFPGTDVAGRNAYPSGLPQVSGNALGKPAPTSDWWSALIKNGQASNLFNYPFTMKTTNNGLVVTYIPWGVIDDIVPVTVGVSGMAATKTTVSDYSDWTVTMDWNDGTHNFKAASGVGMPFLYFTKSTGDVAQITVNSGTVTVNDEMLVLTNVRNGADFAVYAPAGSTWTKNGSVYTSTLNGKNYWSLAFIPLTASNVTTVANEYKKYAFVFPVNTTAIYSYNESTSVMRTDFNVTTEVKEGTETNMLLGLLPHQWDHLAADSPVPNKYSYAIVRGEMKTLAGNSFSVVNTFHGILPTLPYLDNYSAGFSPSALTEKIASLENSTLATWTDSYNEGQVMNQLVQTARIADEMGNIASRNKILSTIKTRLEDWFKVEGGEVAFLFYYNTAWSAMIGYPAGYGQDGSLNDHHFHWGYFIHAAAFVEQCEPGWAAQWGGMVNLLVRDAACPDRNDAMFPYLRNFNPYAGHSFADGFANNPQGNNQESSSESMVFASSLIHWGELTGDITTRNLGIYLYTTEQTGIEEYYMDTKNRNFPPSQQYSLVSRVWGNSFDNGTFWTNDIAASYGIEIYPIHGGSLYLGLDTVYAAKLWNEVAANTGIMSNQANPNLWHDMWWEYLAFTNPAQAIEMYNSYPDREIKFGISDAQTYHWLHAMNALGRVDAAITADYPIAAAFILKGNITYVAHNYSAVPITVKFSTGYQLLVPAYKMATSRDCSITGVMTSSFQQAYVNGSVKLKVVASGGTPTKVEFMDGAISMGIVSAAPFEWDATNLQLGMHSFYAKVFDAERFSVTNSADVQVGNQVPYDGIAWDIPGTIEAGKYDVFEGGKGQNIAYMDVTSSNSGDFRMSEYVDVTNNANEGVFAGSIASGEWIEYTVNVVQAGMYSFAFRYASGNSAGGGPFRLELDGLPVSGDIPVPSTSSTVWTVWATKTVNDIPLTPGQHVLRVAFSNGEFNLAKMTFTRTGDLAFSYPVAMAGNKLKVLLPLTSATIDGSASTESAGKALAYTWTQNYGPSTVQFSAATTAKPVISGLVEGIYSLKLTVTNPDLRTDNDELLVAVSSLANILPSVSLVSPADNSTFTAGKPVTVTATASDFDGSIQKVDFFQNNTLISSDNTTPYTITWNPGAGNYILSAKASDNGGAVSNSQAVNISISPVMLCADSSKTAAQGSFSLGYICTFETVGTTVTVTFELLDNDKPGLVAYLWKESPFAETQMTNVTGKIFSSTLNGQTLGSTISYACKFAYSGGMAVTKYCTYQVGKNCNTAGIGNSSVLPLIFFPNPVSNELNIGNIREKTNISIYDLNGKFLLSKISGSATERMDVSSLSSGIYIIKTSDNKTMRASKMIKQ
ncbi:MAG: glycosyl hydrolase [Bacteroidota bacterium]